MLLLLLLYGVLFGEADLVEPEELPCRGELDLGLELLGIVEELVERVGDNILDLLGLLPEEFHQLEQVLELLHFEFL